MKTVNIFGFIEMYSSDELTGICLFDKYCYTSYYGFEII